MTRAEMYQTVRNSLSDCYVEALAALAALEAGERDADAAESASFAEYWEQMGYLGCNPEEVAELAWKAAKRASPTACDRAAQSAPRQIIACPEGKSKTWPEIEALALTALAATPPAPPAAECACRKALNRLLPLFHVRAKQTDFDYDPAGSSTTYIPNPEDLQFLESLVGRKIDENELYFSCGGNISSRYCVPQKLIGAALAAPRECQRLREENEHLRRRIHQSEGHNQFFERCESAWCNPDQKNNPASEGVGAAWKTPAQYDAELVAAKSEIARLTAEVDARVIQVTTQIRMDHEAIRQWESARDDIAAELREAVDAMRPFADVWDKRPPFDVTSPFRIDCEVGEYGAWHNTSTIVAAYDAKHGEKP